MAANAVIDSKPVNAAKPKPFTGVGRVTGFEGHHMLSLLLALSVAGEAPRVVTLPKRARPAAAMRKRAPRKAMRKPAPRQVKLCLTGACTPVAGANYRLTGTAAPAWSGKLDVVRSKGVPCGVQGAPVCPAKGSPLVRTNID